MDIPRGTRIRTYEIVGLLGTGGMGEVYRAHDTRLGRDVAIKILAHRVSEDPTLLARIEREARLLASLNHPSITTIHGVEDWQGTPAIVMELIEGQTLAVRLFEGPIPPAQVVRIAKFSQTVTTTGSIMGTAPDMSPEQARGMETDRRTDIWSLGCTVYEMLTLLFAIPIVTALMLAGTVLYFARGREAGPLRKFEVQVDGLGDQPGTFTAESGPGAGVVISPDGRRIVYPAAGRLWVRDLSELASRGVDLDRGARRPGVGSGRPADCVQLWRDRPRRRRVRRVFISRVRQPGSVCRRLPGAAAAVAGLDGLRRRSALEPARRRAVLSRWHRAFAVRRHRPVRTAGQAGHAAFRIRGARSLVARLCPVARRQPVPPGA